MNFLNKKKSLKHGGAEIIQGFQPLPPQHLSPVPAEAVA